MRFRITCPCKHKPFFMFLFCLLLRRACWEKTEKGQSVSAYQPISTSSVFPVRTAPKKAMSTNLLVAGIQVLWWMSFFCSKLFNLHCTISAENKFHMEMSRELGISQGILLAMFFSIFTWYLVHRPFIVFCSIGWCKVSSEREDILIY